MLPTRCLPGLLLVLLCFAPMAAAKTTVTAASPSAPIPWDGQVVVPVTITASCATVAQDNQKGLTMAEVETVDAPSWITATSTKAPFGSDECDPATASQASTCAPQPACATDYPMATTQAQLTLKPTVDAPAFESVKIGLRMKGETGLTNITVSVAYRGILNASTPESDLHIAYGEEEAELELDIQATTNAKSMIMFTAKAEPAVGEAHYPTSLDVTPDVAYYMQMGGEYMWMPGGSQAGKAQSFKPEVEFHTPEGAWEPQSLMLEIQLMAYNDTSKVSSPVSVHWDLAPEGTPPGQAKGKSPGPDAVFVLLALVGMVAAARRRGPA